MRLMEDQKGGHLHGDARVRLELVELILNNEKQAINTDQYDKKKGAFSSRVQGEGRATGAAGSHAATASNPAVGAATGAVGPVIAVFSAAKIDMPAGTRIPFLLTAPFTFEAPVAATSSAAPASAVPAVPSHP
jgi:hypothetical protein